MHRGIDRKVDTPYSEHADVCIGCLACVSVCPVGAIEFTVDKEKLDLKTFNTQLTMKSCAECGAEFATMELIENIKSKTRIEFPELLYDCCPACRQRLYSRKLASLKQA